MLTVEIFEKAIKFAKQRNASKGDAQAHLADIDYSYIKNDEIVLAYKPLSGWRFSSVTLVRVKISDIELDWAKSQEGETVRCAFCGEETRAYMVNYVESKGFYCFNCI